ncbi:MAG: MoaD/ThiS family protein [Bacteroidetes bacterium]|nr:MoaD/ThiS family protein [Bacteroidota bacterium]
MKIKLLLFAQLADLYGTHSMVIEDINDTDSLIRELKARNDAIGFHKYVIAVNESIEKGNIILKNNDTVALLPPFAGG